MAKRTKRTRGSNWNHAHTMALAELKREASRNEEDGPLVWGRIAQILSSRFPDQIRTGDQCRRRWDNLKKVYNHIEGYCVQTGQDHRELDEGELDSMELATAYHQDWYDIVEQVCSRRKRKGRCDGDPIPAKRSKSSHSVELPEHPPNRDGLCSASTSKSVTCSHEQLTPELATAYAQVSSGSSFENEKLSPEEEVPRLKNGNAGLVLEQSATACAQVSDYSPNLEANKLSPEEEALWLKHGNDGLMLEQSATAHAQVSSSASLVLEATQLRQHGQISHEVSQEPQTLEAANLPPHTLAAGNGAQLEKPLQTLTAENGAQLDETLQTLAAENGAQLEEPLQTLTAENGAQLEEPLQTLAAENGAQLETLESANLPPHTLAAENGAQLEEPLQTLAAGNGAQLEEPLLDFSSNWWNPQRRMPRRLNWDLEIGSIRVEYVPESGLLGYSWDSPFESPFESPVDSPLLRHLLSLLLGVGLYALPEEPEDDLWDPARDGYLWTFALDDDDSTFPRKRPVRRLKVIRVYRRFRLAWDCVQAWKNALIIRKENVPAMINASSFTSATREDNYLQKDTQRTSNQAALDKKEKETMTSRAERHHLGARQELQQIRACGQIVRKVEQETQILGLLWPILTLVNFVATCLYAVKAVDVMDHQSWAIQRKSLV